jgi:small-conductance mechanosensitive channel
MLRYGSGGTAVLVHEQLAALGADRVPATLTGACGPNPGIACRLVWNLSHNGRAASLTNDWLAGPAHLLVRLLFVVALALVIQVIVHRVIDRLTERAAQSLLPGLRGGLGASRLVPERLAARRRARRGARRGVGGDESALAADAGSADEASAAAGTAGAAGEFATVGDGAAGDGTAGDVTAGDGTAGDGTAAGVTAAAAATDSQGAVNAAAAQAERALVDERRKQRVRALGQILRSAASVTIFSIAGVVILGDLGINLAPLLASAGVVGIAIGFGAQNLVRDYLSGVFMLVEDQYGVGDVITVGDATGTVENVTLRITRLRDVNGIVWHVRNGAIDTVGNESQGWARAVIDFPVPYTADLGTIRTLLGNVADALWNDPAWRVVLLDAPEVWGAQEVTSDEVTMRIVARTAPLRQWEVEREMRARVKTALDAAEITPGGKAD